MISICITQFLNELDVKNANKNSAICLGQAFQLENIQLGLNFELYPEQILLMFEEDNEPEIEKKKIAEVNPPRNPRNVQIFGA